MNPSNTLYFKNLLRFSALIVGLFLFLQPAYAQKEQIEKEILEALTNFEKKDYQKSIPIFEKYEANQELGDIFTLAITVNLHVYYLSNQKEKFDITKVNQIIDQYVERNKIGKAKNENIDDVVLLYYSTFLNQAVEKYDKQLEYLVVLKKFYEDIDQVKCQGSFVVVSAMAECYSQLSNYQASKDVYKELISKTKEVLGDHHPNYITYLKNLSIVYLNLKDFDGALEILLKIVELQKEILGEKHPDYFISLRDLAWGYINLGDNNKALDIIQKVVEYRKEFFGDHHPDYLLALSDLMQVYWNLSDYENALKINLKVVILQKEVLGEKHPDYLEILSRLSATYTKMGKYNKALEISQEVVNSEREVLGEHNTTYLISLSNLASNYSKLGNHDKALDIFMQVVDSQREILGEKHPDYLFSLGHLAVQYRYIGDYTRALEISIKVVNVEREILGERHPDYLLSLSNLSLIYSSLGDWSKALEISQKLISEQKEILGERDLDYLFSLGNLASIYSDLGDYRAALKINKKLANLEKEIFGERHPRFLVSLNNLSLTYLKLHDYKAAMEILLKVIDLQKEILGYRHPDYLSSLNNLALAYSDLGNYSKALTINQKIGELEMEILGDHHPGYLVSLNNLASNYVDLCNYNMALEEIRKVVDLRKNVLGDSHPDYLVSLQNLSLIELYLSQGDSALFHYQKVLTKTKDRVIDYFALMTEFQREQFWRKNSFDFKIFPLFSENASVAHLDTIGFGFDTALFSKGLLLNATRDFDELFAEKGSPEAIAKFEELKQTKLQIQRILEKPIAERYLSVDSLEDIAQKKETELVKLSKEYGDYTRNMKINWKDVQSTLGNKDVAIEFVEYPTLTDTIKYAAFVVRKGWQYPRMISLFRKDQIQEFIKQDKDKIYANGYVGKQLKKLIWDPLEEAISEGDNVYFSASGVLHQLAIENLPANETQTLSEIFHLYRLSSTKEIVLKKAPEKNNSAVLYGGLQFDISNERMLAESKKYEKKENLYAMRGYQSDSTMRKGWGFLEGTLTEVQQINQLLKDKKYKTTFFTGESGNEESFKSLSGKKMGIIHIATHGFFETVADSKKNIFIQLRMGDQTLEKETVDPMIRSGLILSGGNRAWQGDTIPESIEDGVLTAKEICRMDLRGTDLVVLSACETGLGEVSSEGVFGLQRSFKQAGVQTLIMSLWGVNDQATNYMMTQFYTNLLSGKDKREAFLKAKKSCKEKFPEPQYWAAFIMLD